MKPSLHTVPCKLLLFCAVLLSTLTVRAATISTFPYTETSFKGSGWTTYPTGSSNGWTVTSTTSCEASVSKGINNAWLFSPGVQVSSDYKYTFSFKVEATSASWPVSMLDFYILPSASSSATPLMQFARVTTSASSPAVECSIEYVPEESSTVYFTIVDMTDGDTGWKTKISGFTITAELNESKPGSVSDLSYTLGGSDDTEVTLSWTNPATDTFGQDMTISKIIVDCNGTATELTAPALLVPGATVAWTDPTPGKAIMNYTVTVVDADGKESAAKSLTTAYVGPFVGIDVPYEYSFKDNPFNDLWSLTTDGESNEWIMDTQKDALTVSVSNLLPVDATATSPGFNLSNDKLYNLSYKYATTNKGNIINYSVAIGALELEEMHQAYPASNAPEAVNIRFTPAESGQYPLIFHAEAEKMTQSYYTNTLSLTDISIEELPVVPMPATDLRATVDADGNVTLTWTNPTTNETGIPVSGLKANVFRGTEELATLDMTGAEGTYTDTPATGGYHIYSVTVRNAAGASELAPATVVAPYCGTNLDVPFAADFTDKAYQWLGAEYGELTNGNVFTVLAGKPFAQVSEAPKEFADELVSAPVTLNSGHTYSLATLCNTSSSTLSYAVYISATLELAENATPVISETANTYASTAARKEFFVESTGAYYVIIRTLPSTSSYASTTPITFYVKTVNIDEVATVPAPATDVKATVNDEAKTITVSFTMPEFSTLGMPLSGTLSADIYHAGADEAVMTVEGAPGEAISLTHAEPTAEARNSYSIVVTLPGEYGGSSDKATAVSDWFGTTFHTPYVADFNSEEHRNYWQVYDQSTSYNKGKTFEWDEEKQSWVIEEYYNHEFEYNSSMDDWLVSPSLYFMPGAKYEISFDAVSPTGRADRNIQYSVWLSSSNTPVELLKGTRVSEEGSRLDGDSSEGPVTYSHSIDFEDDMAPAARAARADEQTTEPVKRFLGLRLGEAGKYNYPYAEVSNVSINSSIMTGVETVSMNPAQVIGVSATEVFVSDADSAIDIYTTGGVRVASGKGRVGTSGLAHGVYIVRACGQSIKVVR